MKNLRTTLTLLLTLFALFVLMTHAKSDTITLKDGTTLEGKILSESPDAVKIEIQVSPSIKDLKTIPLADIKEIKKLTAEEVDFQKIQKLIPTPPLLSTSDYDTLIRKHVTRFLSTYPDSKHKADVEKILADLQKEREMVAAGSVKIGETWVTADELRKDRINLDAKIRLHNLKQKTAANDIVGALRDFDAMEKSYAGTESYVEAIGIARSLLPGYGTFINGAIRDYEYRMKQRQEKLLLLPDYQRAENEALFQKEIEQHAAATAAANAQGIRWIAVNTNSLSALEANASLVATEIQRLSSIDQSQLSEAARVLNTAKGLLEERKLDPARRALEKGRTLIGKRSSLYIADIEKRAAELETTLAEEAEAARITESEKALEAIQASKTAEAEATTGENPLKAMMDRKKEAASGKDKPSATAAAKPGPAGKEKPPPPRRAATAPPKNAEGFKFYHIMMVLAGILAAVTAVTLVKQKRKEAAESGKGGEAAKDGEAAKGAGEDEK